MKSVMRYIVAVLIVTTMISAIAFASASYSGSGASGLITGTLKVYDSYATATTVNKTSSDANAYVSVKVQYFTSESGTLYWSSASANSGTSYVSSTRRIDDGTVVDAESAHGSSKNSISFNLP